jgi:ABC-type Mn2+/Zn2+ transport system permease subunit
MIHSLWSPFADNEFMRHALLAGVLVTIVCAVSGVFVVMRGLAFVGDALAHGVLPGIAIAMLIGAPTILGAAVGAGVMMAGVGAVTRRTRLSADTAIGLLFVAMLSLGVIITSRSSAFAGDITRILFGEILGVSTAHLWWQAGVALVVAVIVFVFRRPFLLLCIDHDLAQTSGFHAKRYNTLMLSLIALAVVASFQAVGTLLVFGMLIAPAATAALFTRRLGSMIAVSIAVGTVSTYVGLLLSYHFNYAAGATIVLVATGIFLLALVIRGSEEQFVSSHPSHAAHSHGHSHEGHGH